MHKAQLRRPAATQPAQAPMGKAAAVVSPHAAGLAQRNAIMAASPQAGKLAQLAALQLKPREAKVEWQVTHLVERQNDSLFGGPDWRVNEVGEVSKDQALVVDDEDIFMSRRGRNQEDEARRKEDAGQELVHKWLGVLDVEGTPPGPGVYIRAETIAMTPEARRPIIALAEEGVAEQLFANMEQLNIAWRNAERRRRRSIGHVQPLPVDAEERDITSGWNWDQFDEGVNVSGYMTDARERVRDDMKIVEKNWTLRAFYTDEDEGPIAYLILEIRKGDDDGGNYMYVRWLIGHPDKRGGGVEVAKLAISMFEAEKTVREMYVDSAYSAVQWYVDRGFKIESDTVKTPGVGYSDARLKYTKK